MTLDASTISYINQLIISLIGAGFGAVVGAYFGLKLARNWDREKKKEEETEIENRMLNAMIEELKSMKNMVDYKKNPASFQWYRSTNPPVREFRGNPISISTPAYDSAVNSGNFDLLLPTLQTEIGNVYLRLQECKSYNEKIMNFPFTALYLSNNIDDLDREAKNLAEIFNFNIERLREELPNILEKLESAKTDNQKKQRQQTSKSTSV